MRIASVPDADWQLADACDVDALAEAGAGECDVVVAATGDDKSNLVTSLLSKTEYGVPRTVARINNPKNEWLFDETWGVDVAVSTPRIMTALVEEAVSVGSLVSVFTFHQSGAFMHELTLPDDSPVIGELVSEVELPPTRSWPPSCATTVRSTPMGTSGSSAGTSCCSSPRARGRHRCPRSPSCSPSRTSPRRTSHPGTTRRP